MSRATQLSFKQSEAFKKHFRNEHGGSLYKGKRKEARPIATRRPMHVVLRSSRARGAWSFLGSKNVGRVEILARSTAKRFGVQILQIANSGNHLHLIARAKTRQGFQSFLRTLPALLARTITGARKGKSVGKFWDALAYTRLVTWGRELIALKRYLLRNDLEAVGFMSHGERALTFREALAARGLILIE